MDFLNNLGQQAEKAGGEELDTLGSGGPLATDAYPGVIEMAYMTKSKNGAVGVVLNFKLDNGRFHNETVWITNVKGEPTYKDKKTGELMKLPGYLQIDGLCRMLTGKGISENQDVEKKIVKVYSPNDKKEMPTEVPVLVDLCAKKVVLALTRVIANKQKKNAEGKYVNINEKREFNEITKILNEDGLTATEATSDEKPSEEDKFLNREFLAKRKGKDYVTYKEDPNAPKEGTPSTGSAATTAARADTSLFD